MMTEFDPTTALKLVADDVASLRPCDVYRLLASLEESERRIMADFILSRRGRERVALAVVDALADLARGE